MISKRVQGRPKRGETQVGRERIISGFVDMIRSGQYDEISRKQIAHNLGITPALITYYFPKGEFLLKEALKPVFANWYLRLDCILSDKDRSWDQRLSEALHLMISFHKKEAHVETIYLELCRKGILDESIIDTMKKRLSEFFAEDLASEEANEELCQVMANMIWGACQHCASLPRADFLHDLIREMRQDSSRRTVDSGNMNHVPSYQSAARTHAGFDVRSAI